MVNARWERVRENAMARQNLLQQRLNFLQTQQLEEIRQWLNGMEEEMEKAEPLTPDVAATENLIRAHAVVQEKIEKEQEAVKKLSNFVAVVDEEDSDVSYEDLEKLLHSVGERWMGICEWAELRAHQLDEFFQLISQYKMVYKNLIIWLGEREEALRKLVPVENLIYDAQVVEQVEILQQMEAALEAGHADFVSLSQLAVDALAKLDSANSAAAEKLRQEVDSITERWDNIVSRIDKHSQSLVECGKAESRQLLHHDASPISETGSGSRRGSKDSKNVANSIMGNNSRSVSCGHIDVPASADSNRNVTCTSCSNLPCTSVISPVDIFIGNLEKVSEDLQPLIEWAHSFHVSAESDDIRNVIQICQGKLREIKLKEGQVNNLHSELERIRNLGIGAEQLQRANDSFEEFTHKWSEIVTKISDSLNSLSLRGDSKSEEGFEAETLRIANQLEEFFDSTANILRGCAQIPLSEREVRLKKLSEQIDAQQKNIAFLESNFTDKTRVNALKKRMEGMSAEITELIESSQFLERFERYLKSSLPSVKDPAVLRDDYRQCEEYLADLEKIKSDNLKCEELKKLGLARKDTVENVMKKYDYYEEKIREAERTLRDFKNRFSALKDEKVKLPLLIEVYQKLANEVSAARTILKEVEESVRDLASVTSYESVDIREATIIAFKTRVRDCVESWQSLEDEIQENISLISKEIKTMFQGYVRTCRDTVQDLRRAIESSVKASDAEEFSEHLDVTFSYTLIFDSFIGL
ncbi:unnamed protein product [Enterobius vermicularis]|uniref:Dystrophin n=1 Tax=Enterobius vermicularis TaxID=51028 RepID=A0A0N4UT18_ENTVE|nr:unnamed protein product [Enterobius vermicularis]